MESTIVAPVVDQLDPYLSQLRDLQRKVWPAEVPRDVVYPLGEVAVTEYLRQWASERPGHPAIVWYGQRMTYAELDRLSDRVAAHIGFCGLVTGDRVALMMPNVPQFMVVFFGVLKAGCVHVPINPMFRRAEIRYELEDTSARLAFIIDDVAGEFLAASEGTTIEGIVAMSVRDVLPRGVALPRGARDDVVPTPGAARLVDVFVNLDHWVPKDPMDLDALAALNYTGGTTGMPKGCEHTQRHMLYTAATGAIQNHALDRDSVSLLYLPVFWIAGEDGFLTSIVTGGTLVLQYRYDADEIVTAIDRHRVTSLVGIVDNLLEIMESAKRLGVLLSSIETVTSVSFVTKLSEQIRAHWLSESGSTAIMRESSYGMTEDHTLDTFTRGLHEIDLKGSPGFVGLPMPGTDIAIVDFDTGKLTPAGHAGQIIIRSPSVMRAYYRKEAATATALRNGWLYTGDIGLIDAHGCLHYLGRRKEMLKVKGMSVFPSELEFYLSQHPDIVAVGVIGQPDQEKGEIPLAFVQLREGASQRPEEIAGWCRSKMAPYKVPRVRIIPEMPLAPTGKVLKSELERYVNV